MRVKIYQENELYDDDGMEKCSGEKCMSNMAINFMEHKSFSSISLIYLHLQQSASHILFNIQNWVACKLSPHIHFSTKRNFCKFNTNDNKNEFSNQKDGVHNNTAPLYIYSYYLQCNRFIPLWVQWSLNCFSFLFDIIAIVWNKLKFDVGIAQTIRIHWNEISALFDWNNTKKIIRLNESEGKKGAAMWFGSIAWKRLQQIGFLNYV